MKQTFDFVTKWLNFCPIKLVTFEEGECHGKKEGPGADLILGHDSGAGRVEITAELFDQGEVQSGHLDDSD